MRDLTLACVDLVPYVFLSTPRTCQNSALHWRVVEQRVRKQSRFWLSPKCGHSPSGIFVRLMSTALL